MSGSKYHPFNGPWSQTPQILGTWPSRISFMRCAWSRVVDSNPHKFGGVRKLGAPFWISYHEEHNMCLEVYFGAPCFWKPWLKFTAPCKKTAVDLAPDIFDLFLAVTDVLVWLLRRMALARQKPRDAGWRRKVRATCAQE